MRNKTLVLLLAGICGTVAAVGIGQWMQANTGSPKMETAEILVITKAINAEDKITADQLRLERWPKDKVPKGASADLKKFEGRYAKMPLFPGEAIVDVKLMDSVEDDVVPDGYTVLNLPVRNGAAVNLLEPGKKVTVTGFFERGDQFLETFSVDVLRGIRIYSIDGIKKFTEDNPRPKSPRNIQLLIRKADQTAFEFAKRTGDVELVLGSTGTVEEDLPAEEVSTLAQKFLAKIEEQQERARAAQTVEATKTQEPVVPVATVTPVATVETPKKAFVMEKYVNGRVVRYEFAEDGTMQKLGDSEAESTQPSSANSNAGTAPGNTDALIQGAESPFFMPSSEGK
jgi:pilus assembly protein CpaB